MTNAKFKSAIQSEMKREGFNAKIIYSDRGNFNTVFTLAEAPSKFLTAWFNERFTYGVRVAGNQIIINTPNESNK